MRSAAGPAAATLLMLPVFAQDAPLAPPADNSQPPQALPVAPPVAQPVTPDQGAAPVALPVLQAPPAAPVAGAQITVTTPAAARWESAMNFYSTGDYTDAVTAFSDFVANFPEDRRREEALYRLAESYRNLKRPEDALAAYKYEVENYPEGPLRVSAELRRGLLLFDAGNFSDAIPALQFVSDKGDAGDVRDAARFFLAKSYLATKKENDAQALLQPLAEAEPAGKLAGNAAEALAELDDARGDAGAALGMWQKAVILAADPAARARAAARGGWSALTAKQPKEAERLFTAARGSSADAETRTVANTGLLRILFQQKRYTDWLKIYKEASAASPPELLATAKSELLFDLGHVNFALKNWKEAVGAFDGYLASYGHDEAAVTAAYERFLAIAQMDKSKTAAEAENYLRAWPKSPYRDKVKLLEAQELSREKNFTQALPIWEELAAVKGGEEWPKREILLEVARAYDELGQDARAATAYQNYIDAINSVPGDSHSAKQVLAVQARLAVCLQKSNQLIAATDAWKAVQASAADGSTEQEAALEALGLIYAKGGPAQESAMVETFRKLLATFPQSPLKALAAFTVGDAAFKARDYAAAESMLKNARDWDSKTWTQPATQRLALGAYGQKDYAKTVGYARDYDTVVALLDPQARTGAQLPPELYYWLGESARKSGKWDDAQTWYLRVTRQGASNDLLAGAWWQLGEVQSHEKQWANAVDAYQKYRGLKPDAKDATVVLLALGRAELGAGQFDAAKKLGEQALLQEPEGPRSAAARTLLGEVAFGTNDFAGAARAFATLAVLFDDPQVGPQAMARAADSFERAGDAKSAAEWRGKLKAKYPAFVETPYL